MKTKRLSFFGGGGTLSADCVNKENAVLYEKCVICGQTTEVLKATPIQERHEYINGSGQLCSECYFKLYLEAELEAELPSGNGRI